MKRTRIQAARRHKRDQADLAVTRKETGCSVPRSHKAIVLWSLCSIHRSLTCQHWFCTVPFGHSVPSTLSTLVLYSVLCSLCSIHPVNTGSVQCPLLTLFHPPCQHWFCTVSFAHSVPSTLSTLVLYSVLCSLCSIHRSLTCQHWFCTVSFAHSVPSTLSTLVLYSVLCSLCSSQYVHVLYSVLWSFCSICTVHTGSIRCPLVSLFHPPSAHRFYTVSFAHSVPPSTYRFCTVSFARCSIRPVHTDLRQCSIITQFQYTHFTL